MSANDFMHLKGALVPLRSVQQRDRHWFTQHGFRYRRAQREIGSALMDCDKLLAYKRRGLLATLWRNFRARILIRKVRGLTRYYERYDAPKHTNEWYFTNHHKSLAS